MSKTPLINPSHEYIFSAFKTLMSSQFETQRKTATHEDAIAILNKEKIQFKELRERIDGVEEFSGLRESFEQRLEHVSLNSRVAELEKKSQAAVGFEATIDDLFDNEVRLKQAIRVVIRADGEDSFICLHLGSEVSMSGDTVVEAHSNFVSHIAILYKMLMRHPISRLGPKPRKQRKTLESLIEKVD